MIELFPDYMLAADNDNIGDLAAFTSLVTSPDDEGFDAPRSYAKWRQGERHKTGDGNDFWEGYPSVEWIVSRCTTARFEELRDTILNGAYSGPVTVQTLKGGTGTTFADYNAILSLEELPDLDNPPGTSIFLDFKMTYSRLEYLQDAA